MKLPLISSSKLIKVLSKEGFKFLKQKGSHISLQKKTENKTLLVIIPRRKQIKRGTLLNILRQAGMTRDDFLELLK